jgi:hypothetical protein
VAEPAEHPPKTRGDRSAALVVGDDPVAGLNPPNAERRSETLAIRQRVSAFVRARAAREIVVEMRVARAGNVAAVVRCFSGFRSRQREAAIDDDPIGAVELARQRSNVNEWIRCHRAIVASHERLAPRC